MPTPFAAGLGYDALATAASRAGMFALSQAQTPVVRGVQQRINRLDANVLPGVSEIMDAVRQGVLSETRGRSLLALHGVYLPFADQLDPYGVGWQAAYEAGATRPALDVILRQLRVGVLSRADAVRYLRYLGVQFTEDQDRIIATNFAPLSLDVAQDLVRRGQMTRDEFTANLADLGVLPPAWQTTLYDARVEVPRPGELIAWVGRRAYDDDWSLRMGLDVGGPAAWPDQYKAWAKWGGVDPDALRFAWRAHWQTIPFGTLLSASYRLRPDRLDFWRGEVPGVQPLDQQTLDRLVTAEGIPGAQAAWANVAARPLPSVRQYRLLFKHQVWTERDIADSLKDHGYTSQDADDIAHVIARETLQEDPPQAALTSMAKVREGFALGAITEETARQLIGEHGYLGADADAWVANVRTEAAIDRVKKSVEAIRRMRLRGALSQAEATLQLVQAGIDAIHAGDLTDLWELDLQSGRKQLGAGQVMDYLRRGILTLLAAEVRLDNLGYGREDIAAMLVRVEQEVAGDQQKQLEAALRRIEALQRKAEQALARARARHREQVTALKAHGSPAQLREWVRDGTMSRDEALGRLQQMDWPFEDAVRLIESEAPPKPGGTAGGTAGGPKPGGKPGPGAKSPLGLSIAQSIKLFRDGVESESELRARLSARGWPVEDIDDIIEDVTIGRARRGGGAGGGAPGPPPPSGPPQK